jgi:pyocin large subunit-like protein
MNRRVPSLILAIVIAVALVVFLPRALQRKAAVPAPVSTAAGELEAPEDAEAPAVEGIGFRSDDSAEDHYGKHGREFGKITIVQYVGLAQTLRDRPTSDQVIEEVRADGVVTRFDRASGAFLAFDLDGTIRTFFKPSDGEAYFRRQLTSDPE